MMPAIDHPDIDRQARQIKARASAILTKWGLLPRFERWRLTQDPDTGLIVLFGILNNSFIATHTSIPFSDYFDPRLLNDLANELQVEVVSCNSDGLRYAFILDRGRLVKLPTHITYPFISDGKPVVAVVYRDPPQSIPASPVEISGLDDHALVDQGVGAFLKVFDDIKLRDDAALQLAAQESPRVIMIDEEQFKQRVAEHEAKRQRQKRVSRLFDRRKT